MKNNIGFYINRIGFTVGVIVGKASGLKKDRKGFMDCYQ